MPLILVASIVLGYWFNITPPVGEYDNKPTSWSVEKGSQSRIVFDLKHSEELIRNFNADKANGRRFYLDIDHKYEETRKPNEWYGTLNHDYILGTVERLRLANDGSVQALIVFFEKGLKVYEKGDFNGISPSLMTSPETDSSRYYPFMLNSIAATKRPFFKNLPFKDCGKEEIAKEHVER